MGWWAKALRRMRFGPPPRITVRVLCATNSPVSGGKSGATQRWRTTS
jgi:hypothetical protein